MLHAAGCPPLLSVAMDSVPAEASSGVAKMRTDQGKDQRD